MLTHKDKDLKVYVAELKGLLKAIEDDCQNVRINLANDNVKKCYDKLEMVRAYLVEIRRGVDDINYKYPEDNEDDF